MIRSAIRRWLAPRKFQVGQVYPTQNGVLWKCTYTGPELTTFERKTDMRQPSVRFSLCSGGLIAGRGRTTLHANRASKRSIEAWERHWQNVALILEADNISLFLEFTQLDDLSMTEVERARSFHSARLKNLRVSETKRLISRQWLIAHGYSGTYQKQLAR